MIYEGVKGTRRLFHGKYGWSGVIRETEGKWLVLDDAWMHFWADAEKRIRDTELPPIFLGDGFFLNTDYVEGSVAEAFVTWAADEAKLQGVGAKAKRGR